MTKTGTEILGTRLFWDPFAIVGHLHKLPGKATTYIEELKAQRPGADPAALRQRLHTALGVEPLKIGSIVDIRIETGERSFLNDYRCLMSGYLAEARVAYSGCPAFFRWQPRSNFQFDYPGKIGGGLLKLRIFLDSKDFDRFEADVETALASARGALGSMTGEQILAQRRATDILDQVADAANGSQ